MITLKLPDGSIRSVAPGSKPIDVANGIGKRLAQAAIAAKVDGKIVDLDREFAPTDDEVPFQLLTDKDPESLDVLRHSCAHIMARAVMRVFPDVQLAFGPTIENGFYYDIDSPTPITEADFPKIEAEMKVIIGLAEPFERFERDIPTGTALCRDLKQMYKVQHITEELVKYGGVSFYRQGEFIDLCRGPHIPHAGKVGAYKILSIAGAYWKNDSSRKQLQRLYATAFFTQKDLDSYLALIEEAKKRDHRTLGKQLKLFHISPMAGQGLILWMPKGAMVRSLLEGFIKDELLKRGYSPVYTPHIGRLELYRTSGHFPYYRDAQYPPLYYHPAAAAIDLSQYRLSAGELTDDKEREMTLYLEGVGLNVVGYAEATSQADKLRIIGEYVAEVCRAMNVDIPALGKATTHAERAEALLAWLQDQEGYLLKPMNCPHHIQIYKATPHSYRDLPIRLAEFGTVYRHEQTGELNGMTRVRGFTQDDAHLFMTPEQVEGELRNNIELVLFIFKTLGLDDYRVRIGLRDPKSDKYVGSKELWDNAERTLISVVKNLGMNYKAEEGEAAFYGPKIDFVVRDCIGRDWQLGTVQLDYNLPNRFDLDYTGADNQKHRPVMIHRAPFGSMERFCGILIEHFAGSFPLWLAPEQARILPISEKFNDYGREVENQLKAAGLRVTGDYRPEKIGARIRDGSLEKIPYLLIVGEKESTAGTVSIRDESVKDMKARDLGSFRIEDLIVRMKLEMDEKRIRGTSSATAGLTNSGAKFED